MWTRYLHLLLLAWVGAAAAAEPVGIRIIAVKEPVEISRNGGVSWDTPSPKSDPLKPGDRLRTGPKGSVELRMNDKSIKRVGELSSLIVPSEGPATRMRFFKGIGYFFNRDKPGETQVEGPLVGAVVKGTEFIFEVDDDGNSKVTVLEGEVTLTNALGEVTLTSGQSGIAGTNTAPRQLPVLVSDMPGAIQWALYYPGVLDLKELPFSPAERERFAPILSAYASGDLRQALKLIGDAGELRSPAAKLLGAALDLTGGRAAQARVELENLKDLEEIRGPVRALRWLIDAVQFKVRANDLPALESLATSSEMLALSYARQSLRNLPGALLAARAAAGKSPDFGFAWARVGELEFSFGRSPQSSVALEKALQLSPRNAQAAALQGFTLAAQNKITEAATAFENAIALDSGLANGWLGRGLLRIRRGDETGQEDLLIAAAMEPQRAFLRSYLGKLLYLAGNTPKARHELELAKQSDPADPTPWLYGALLNQNENRINEALRDLESSQTRVTNRSVFRSDFLLDQDRAVQGAHLASIYRDAGMEEQSRHAAANSLAYDYGNASAHLFLAESYLSLDRVNLRYEGARVSEYLLANLLSPAGAGAWSPAMSQQEYSALFERDGAGVVSSTEYRSNGSWYQSAAAYGNWSGANATLDGLYFSDPGFRPNNDVQISSVSLQYKQQITPQDTLYVQPLWSSAESGDLVEYYNDAMANPGIRVREKLEPIVLAGWRHDWSPQNKTVLLTAYLTDDLRIDDPYASAPRINSPQIPLPGFDPYGERVSFDQKYRSRFEAASFELQQIAQTTIGESILGGLAQLGSLRIDNSLAASPTNFPPPVPQGEQKFRVGTERYSLYAYQTWKPFDRLQLIGGLSYDRMDFPSDFRQLPLQPTRASIDQLSPKAGLAANLWRGSTLRAAYAKSLGGIGFDQSFRIEPSQIAGINQRFRSMVPEAIAGSHAGERMEMGGLDFSQQFGANTWLSASPLWLVSKVSRSDGILQGDQPVSTITTIDEDLRYRERSLQLTINRLIGRDVAVGASYSIGEAAFRQTAPDLFQPAAREAGLVTSQKSILQQATLFGVMNHPSGFFFRAEAIWMHQDNRWDVANLTGDDFWHGNLYAGYRFAKRRVEIATGLLNITDDRYQLHPLNLHAPLARERTFFVSLKWSL